MVLRFAFVAALLAVIAAAFNNIVPTPYMVGIFLTFGPDSHLKCFCDFQDEFFHFRQTNEYCNGNWHVWDDKITTLPGVYLIAAGIFRSLSVLLGMPISSICTLSNMRLLSVVFGMGNLALIEAILREKNAKQKGVFAIALSIFLFPVIFFFYFQFYTDAGGLFFVLLTVLCFQRSVRAWRDLARSNRLAPTDLFPLVSKKWIFFAALSGLLAVLFRQTNIIWVLFSAASLLVELYEARKKDYYPTAHLSATGPLPDPRDLFGFVKFCFHRLPSIVSVFYPVILVGGMFAAFLVWNGSITVGDKSAHAAVFHWPQLLYFFLVLLVFFIWDLLRTPTVLISELSRHAVLVVPFTAVNGFLVSRFTYAHLYLISDNRHYTFYLWKKVFERFALARYLLLPLYYIAVWFVLGRVLQHKSHLWKLLFVACAGLTVIPAELVEFRYFIIPTTIAAIFDGHANVEVAKLRAFGFALVNLATIAVFLLYPFRWPDGSEARFMW